MRWLKPASWVIFALLLIAPAVSRGQAALLLEQPYGFFGTLNPTGHAAIYLARVCADTPVSLRRCRSDEAGVVISRYSGIGQYDWVAIPLVPYLYSVENLDDVPRTADRKTVTQLRKHYREQHLLSLGEDLPAGGFFKGGWAELIGASYERRIYAYRFETSEAEDDRLIALLNGGENLLQFKLFYNNCSDFARMLLNNYFPGTFKRSIFPDAGATTPKQITYKLLKYGKQHTERRLQVFVIPQIPGYHRKSWSNHGIAESLITTGYAVPIVLINPYIAGGLFVDYLVRGRHKLVPNEPELADPEHMEGLTASKVWVENPRGDEAENTSPSLNEEREPIEP